MSKLTTENALKLLTSSIRKLVQLNKIDEAFTILEREVSKISNSLSTTIILQQASYNELNKSILEGVLTSEQAIARRVGIKGNILRLMATIPAEIETQLILGNIHTSIYTTTEENQLEAIIGTDNLSKINWLEKGIKASKSVCQVVREDGKKGTGFLLEGGYLMTNFHVLPNKERAEGAKIVFDYEEDMLGNQRTTSEYFLEAEDSKFSPLIDGLDYAYIKVRDKPEKPLSGWGVLELDDFSEPQLNDPVTIIQHPLGETKQIALTANEIVSINKPKLFYSADTQRGSSGSPVFNKDWRVIALHHAGRSDKDGGLIINAATGERKGANEGILIKDIIKDLKGK